MDEKNKEVKENKKEEVKKVEPKKDEKNEIKKVEENKTKNEEPKFKKVDKKEVEKQTKKNEPKKENKKATWVPTLIAVVVVLLIAALLTVMIITSSAPKKSLDSLLTNLKAGDFEKAQQYMSGDVSFTTDSLAIETQGLLFDKLEWKINKATENGDNTATIEVEITTKDFQAIINNYKQKILEAAKGAIIGGGSIDSISSEDFEKYFAEELKNENVQTTKINATINAVKEDKDWKIVSDEALINAILPGLQEAVDAL